MSGHRTIEKEIREHLVASGLDGRSARVRSIELVAIEPPGWIQIYRFEVELRVAPGRWVERWGVVRDDERMRRRYHLAESPAERDRIQREWSGGLDQRRASSPVSCGAMTVLFALLPIGAAVALAIAL